MNKVKELNKVIKSIIEKVKLENDISWKNAELNENMTDKNYESIAVISEEIAKIAKKIIKLDEVIKGDNIQELYNEVSNNLYHMIDNVTVKYIKEKYEYMIDGILYDIVVNNIK